MTDFMRWLYTHYIEPELETDDTTGYEAPLSLMETCLDPYMQEQYARAIEYYASRAFCLGFRTGQGMANLFPPEPEGASGIVKFPQGPGKYHPVR